MKSTPMDEAELAIWRASFAIGWVNGAPLDASTRAFRAHKAADGAVLAYRLSISERSATGLRIVDGGP